MNIYKSFNIKLTKNKENVFSANKWIRNFGRNSYQGREDKLLDTLIKFTVLTIQVSQPVATVVVLATKRGYRGNPVNVID